MIEINEYFEIDWEATGSKLKELLLKRVSINALSEWADRDERTIRNWLRNPSAMGIERLVMIAKFLDIDLLSIVVTKGQQEKISLLEQYFDGVESVAIEYDAQSKPKGKPRKYNPNCITAQQFFEKALFNEYGKRRNEYIPIRTTEEFLLYFPLIDQFKLSDFVYRTMGDVCHNRGYVYKNMDWLISSIPTSDAKRYADKMRYFCLSEPNVYEISDCVINDNETNLKIDEYYAYRDSDDYIRESEAYYAACRGASERLAFLCKLKVQLEDVLKGQIDY